MSGPNTRRVALLIVLLTTVSAFAPPVSLLPQNPLLSTPLTRLEAKSDTIKSAASALMLSLSLFIAPQARAENELAATYGNGKVSPASPSDTSRHIKKNPPQLTHPRPRHSPLAPRSPSTPPLWTRPASWTSAPSSPKSVSWTTPRAVRASPAPPSAWATTRASPAAWRGMATR